jgi:hypothetical protein
MSWVAGASIFSGRPDPVWEISDELGERLRQLWNALSVTRDQVSPSPPPLGYRGCFVVGPESQRWSAYRQVVTLQVGDRSETRHGDGAEFEALVLSSAPEGTLPPSVP